MRVGIWACAVTLALASCSGSGPAAQPGHVVVAITVDWEGAYFSSEGLDALDDLRKQTGDAPITHFASPAYFLKDQPDPKAETLLTETVHPGDELALHLHVWRSLARAAKVEPRLSPSFLTGTDKLLPFEDGDTGFDVDLDAYSVTDLRAMVRTGRQLLADLKIPVSKSFRAGGYLGTPKVLQAIREEGFTVDSSATDSHQVVAQKDAFLAQRIHQVWPAIEVGTQPYLVDKANPQLIEMPIAVTADYVTAAQIASVFEAAHARLQKDPSRDVFVVLGCNQETAQDFAGTLGTAIAGVRARPELASELVFTTVEKAADRARAQLAR